MKEDTSSRPLWQTAAGWFSIITTLGVAAYASWIFSGGHYSSQVDEVVSRLGLAALYLGLSILGFYLVLRRELHPTLRQAWLALTLGAASRGAGHIINLYAVKVQQIEAFPGLGDVFFTLYYPLTIAGLLLFIFAYVPRQDRALLGLDLVILGTFFGILMWYYFIASPLFFSNGYVDKVLTMVYPTGDFLILAGSISLMQLNLSRATRWIITFFAIAMIFAAAGDLLFAFYEITGIRYIPAYLALFWMCAVQMEIFAAARQITSGAGILADPPAKFNRFRSLLRLALPYLAVIASLAFLAGVVNARLTPEPRLTGLLVGAYALVGLVLFRQYIVLEENVRLYQKMRHIAWTDSLTGVYNRHFFNEMLPREIERAGRYQKQLSVLLLDIDGFKKYNDTFGHLQGDMVLKAMARSFARQSRASDIIARFGGDEFVVILPETNRRMAKSIAERIRRAVENQPETRNRLGVSIGIGVFRPGLTPEQLIDEADQELYRDKNIRKLLAEGTPGSIADTAGEAGAASPGASPGEAQPAPAASAAPEITQQNERQAAFGLADSQATRAIPENEGAKDGKALPETNDPRLPERPPKEVGFQLTLPLVDVSGYSPLSSTDATAPPAEEPAPVFFSTAKAAPRHPPKHMGAHEHGEAPAEEESAAPAEALATPALVEETPSPAHEEEMASPAPAEAMVSLAEDHEPETAPTAPLNPARAALAGEEAPAEAPPLIESGGELAEGGSIPAPEISPKSKKPVASEAEAR
ncbi:MAG: diguanylate cyclase [Anaerolineales bacterium]|nr:diguanylate cyclase [Anaerolineales bacterium]